MVCVALGAVAACRDRGPLPVPIDTRTATCQFCNMSIGDIRFAAEGIVPGGRPMVFDDLGCVKSWVVDARQVPAGLVFFVVDHRTKQWVRADRAVFTRVEGLQTPMGSGLIAHADDASRAADPAAAGGHPVPLADVVPAR